MTISIHELLAVRIFMSAARKIIHVDDSKIALKLVKESFSDEDQNNLIQFQAAEKCIENLIEDLTSPNLIISDLNMPGMTGRDLLSWIKRNPKLHYTPVVLLTVETSEEAINELKKSGAFAVLSKPLNIEAFKKIYLETKKNKFDEKTKRENDLLFSEEVLERVSELQTKHSILSKKSHNVIYGQFHTIKGGSSITQFYHLAQFIHLSETFISAVKKGNIYSVPRVQVIYLEILSYLESQMDSIKKNIVLSQPENLLTEGMKDFIKQVDQGLVLSDNNLKHIQSIPENNIDIKNGIVSKTKTSIRVTHEKIDELQSQFKKIIQIKTQLSRFSNQLKEEFQGESFTLDLEKIVKSLDQHSGDLLEFFLQVRLVPAMKLKSMGEKVVDETCRVLSKKVNFQFESEPFLEIDQKVNEVLEEGINHILRNCIDHGLEKEEDRLSMNKSAVGNITLSVKKHDAEFIHLEIKDDGKGINPSILRDKVKSLNLMKADDVDKFKDEEAIEFIFLPGLSTKGEVSEISGRGFGLSAVKEAILNIGGKINVESKLGVGTSFKIFIPRMFKL
jgi:two-component system chemotaxis sensor kinase CheA